jgi:diguanylate cyclase (GGDEF)-like protein
VTFWPPLFFFAVGAWGSTVSGTATGLTLFYVIAFLLVGVLIGARSMFSVMVASLVIHFAIAIILHGEDVVALIPVGIVVSATFLGIALLQWLSQSVMNHALEQCFLDPLTGVHNRSYFEGTLLYFQQRQRYAFPVSLLMADIDGLKKVNDAFGHAAGDALIVRAAYSLQRACRKEDVVCRIGGDEFVVLLPKTDAAVAASIAGRVSDLIELDAPLVADIQLSLATGVATATTRQSIRDALDAADANLYAQKKPHSA